MTCTAFVTALGLVNARRRPNLRDDVFCRPLMPVTRPASRALLRMQDDNGDDAEDEAPSDTYVPASEAVKAVIPGTEESKRHPLVAKLLQLAAVTGRGQLATDAQKTAVDDVIMSLEEINPNPQPVETDAIDGTWSLIYSTAKLFQSNPFLMAAASPLLQLGQIRQVIAVDDGKLSTEVDVLAFPLTSGTITTTARVTPVGADRLELAVQTTTIKGGKIADRFDLGGISFDVPVEQIYSRIKNAAPETYFDTYYLDDKLRISRSKQGKLFVYTRMS